MFYLAARGIDRRVSWVYIAATSSSITVYFLALILKSIQMTILMFPFTLTLTLNLNLNLTRRRRASYC